MSAPPGPSSLSTLLSQSQPIILDGALATYLESLGADISSALWSASILVANPSLVYQTHLDYFRAGAEIAVTVSYQASVPGLMDGLGISEQESKDLIKKSVELAKDAREAYLKELRAEESENWERKSTRLLVAGSVGPYGAFLADGSEYRGDYVVSKDDMKVFHRGRIAALVDAGVDVLACETMPNFQEVEVLLELLQEEFPSTEAWVSFTLRDGDHMSDGTNLEQVIALVTENEQVVAMGVNCVPEGIAKEAITMMASRTKTPLIVYPNSGELWDSEKRDWYGERNEGAHLKELALGFWNIGARIIGGCCRTTPDDIKVVRQALYESL